MAGGDKNIHNHPNAGKGGFHKNPQNINKKGRPSFKSITDNIKELLEENGTIRFPASQVVRIEDDGSVVLAVPTTMQIAMKLIGWSMSKKGVDSIRAIEKIMERIEGKPVQPLDHSGEVGQRIVINEIIATQVNDGLTGKGTG